MPWTCPKCEQECQDLWVQCNCGETQPPLGPSAEYLEFEEAVNDRKNGWLMWKQTRAENIDTKGDKYGLRWTLTETVPVYYQGDDYVLSINTDAGKLIFANGEFNTDDFKSAPLADMTLAVFKECVGQLLDLTPEQQLSLVIVTVDGLEMDNTALVTKESQGESDSDDE